MKRFTLLFLAFFTTSFAQVVKQTIEEFQVIIPDAPALDACDDVMMGEILDIIARIVEEAGTDYITRSGRAGEMYDAVIEPDEYFIPNRDLAEDVGLETVDEQGRRLYTFLYGRVPCRMCPPDNSDGRRYLNNVGNAVKEYSMDALYANVNRWIAIRLPRLSRALTTASKNCVRALRSWTPSVQYAATENIDD
jgi:hypothetical protein